MLMKCLQASQCRMAICVGRAAAIFVPNGAYNQLIQCAQDLSEVITLHSIRSSVVCHFNTESIANRYRTSLTHFPSTQDRRDGALVT